LIDCLIDGCLVYIGSVGRRTALKAEIQHRLLVPLENKETMELFSLRGRVVMCDDVSLYHHPWRVTVYFIVEYSMRLVVYPCIIRCIICCGVVVM